MRILASGLGYFIDQFRVLAKLIGSELNFVVFSNRPRAHGGVRSKLVNLVQIAFTLPHVDIWYQLGGISCKRSFLYRWAQMLRVPTVIHWVGSDVLLIRRCPALRSFLRFAVHWAGAPWLVDELRVEGIEAQFLPLPLYSVFSFLNQSIRDLPEQFRIATYLLDQRPEFYGWTHIQRLARELPHIPFLVVGAEGNFLDIGEKFDNVRFLGWIPNVQPVFESSVIVLRLTAHDGYGGTVQEALALGRYVIWTYPLPAPGAFWVSCWKEAKEHIERLYDKYSRGELQANYGGRQYIRENLNPLRLTRNLLIRLVQIAGAQQG